MPAATAESRAFRRAVADLRDEAQKAVDLLRDLYEHAELTWTQQRDCRIQIRALEERVREAWKEIDT